MLSFKKLNLNYKIKYVSYVSNKFTLWNYLNSFETIKLFERLNISQFGYSIFSKMIIDNYKVQTFSNSILTSFELIKLLLRGFKIGSLYYNIMMEADVSNKSCIICEKFNQNYFYLIKHVDSIFLMIRYSLDPKSSKQRSFYQNIQFISKDYVEEKNCYQSKIRSSSLLISDLGSICITTEKSPHYICHNLDFYKSDRKQNKILYRIL